MKNRPEFKTCSISTMVKYACIAYNYSIHSATGIKPIEIITGHMEPNRVLDLDDIQITRDYVSSLKDKTKALYEIIHPKLSQGKEHKIASVKTREQLPPNIPTEVFVKNRQKQNKIGNKYKKETKNSTDTERKTAEIEKEHANTSERIHLSNVRRPNVPRNFPTVSEPGGPSCSHQQLKSLTHNAGIFPVKMGDTRLQRTSYTIIHYYTLAPLLEETDDLQERYDHLQLIIKNKPYLKRELINHNNIIQHFTVNHYIQVR